MSQHVRTVLLATAALVALGSMHSLSTAIARPAAAKAVMRTEPERPASAAISTLASASLRSISVGF